MSYLPPDKKLPGVPVAGTGKKPFGCGMGCLILVGAVVVLSIIFAITINAGKSSNPSAGNKYEAIAQCEARVKNLLKSPSSAKFDSAATGSESDWKVSGTVDAENSFGASLRTSFGCTVVINGQNATTTVDYFQ